MDLAWVYEYHEKFWLYFWNGYPESNHYIVFVNQYQVESNHEGDVEFRLSCFALNAMWKGYLGLNNKKKRKNEKPLNVRLILASYSMG